MRLNDLKETVKTARRILLKNGCEKDLRMQCLTLCLMVARVYPEIEIGVIEKEFFLLGKGGHAVIVHDSLIIDGTATQFGKYRAVEIFSKHLINRKKWFWNIENMKTYTYKQIKRKYSAKTYKR